MILTPMMPPFEISLARRMWKARARRLALKGSRANSGSRQPGWAAEMTPIPPALATAPARDERLMPTPIPPWMMGYLAVRFPIFKFGNI